VPDVARFASPVNLTVPPARPGEFRPLVLGPLSVWPPVVLAPMAGVTNYPFRTLCRAFGAGLYVSEMITADGFTRGNARTLLLASSQPDERPRSVQIYGSDPDAMSEVARRLAGEGVHHIDINFGCPAPKITRRGGGSAIPVKPRLMARLVRAAVRGAGTVPVTVKVWKGIDDDLHLPRRGSRRRMRARRRSGSCPTAVQLYAGDADWAASPKESAVRFRCSATATSGVLGRASDAAPLVRRGDRGAASGGRDLQRARHRVRRGRAGNAATARRDRLDHGATCELLMASSGPSTASAHAEVVSLVHERFHGAGPLRVPPLSIESLDDMLDHLQRLTDALF
jgi:hypothetical protein